MKLKAIIIAGALLAVGLIAQFRISATVLIEPAKIQHDAGSCYSFLIPAPHFKLFSVSSDSLAHPQGSKSRLFENDVESRFAHSLQEDIRQIGAGRFLHWKKNQFYFSASDNSNPRKNGKKYSILTQTGFAPWIRVLGKAMILLAGGLFCFSIFRWASLFSGATIRIKLNAFGMILFYVAFIMAVNFAASLYLYQSRAKTAFTPSASGNVTNKQVAYATDPSRYDLAFVGDSRTYTDIQPFILNKNLKNRSINLAGFTNWFPTQYPHYKKLAPIVPSKQIVVWSLGHQNFHPGGLIQTQYPIGFKNVPRYLGYGFKLSQLWANLSYFNPLTQVFDQAKTLRSVLNQKTDRIFLNTALATGSPENILEKENEKIKESTVVKKYLNDPLIAGQALHAFNSGADGKVNSMAITFNDGSYYLVELDSPYFRQKQIEMMRGYDKVAANNGLEKTFQPDPSYWKLFVAMLDLFEKNHVRLVVNEIEEAPFTYITPEKRAWCRKFMRQVVQPEVERRGHIYLRANWDIFTDADYFDYNHLNAAGAKKYSEMLAQLLKPVLKEGK